VAYFAFYSFVSTVGQPMTGQGISASYSACSGYWRQILASYKVMLPLVVKNP
jgi:hypothetical protein